MGRILTSRKKKKKRASFRDRVRKRLLILRKKRGLTQKRLAERAGLSAIQVSQYERGFRFPSVETLHRMAEALETTVSEITGDKPQEVPTAAAVPKDEPEKTTGRPKKVCEVRRAKFGKEVSETTESSPEL